jgi:hypothetical protein
VMNPYLPVKIEVRRFGRKVRERRRRFREEVAMGIVLNAIWILPIVVAWICR